MLSSRTVAALFASTLLLAGQAAHAEGGVEFVVVQDLAKYTSTSEKSKEGDADSVKKTSNEIDVGSPKFLTLSATYGSFRITTLPLLFLADAGTPLILSFFPNPDLELGLMLGMGSSSDKNGDEKTTSSSQIFGVSGLYTLNFNKMCAMEMGARISMSSSDKETKASGTKTEGSSSKSTDIGLNIGYLHNFNANLSYFAGVDYTISNGEESKYNSTLLDDVKTDLDGNDLTLTLAQVRYRFN